MLKDGDPVPHGTLVLDDGSTLDLADTAGRALLLYCYPRADTPGCTVEAQEFSEAAPDFDAIDVRVVALSKDTPAKLAKFRAKYDLGIILASDAEGHVIEDLGAWVEKNMYGKKSMGIERSTFLFDASGRLVRQWRKVRARGHAAEVLAAARAL